jgi:hypothetical protein
VRNTVVVVDKLAAMMGLKMGWDLAVEKVTMLVVWKAALLEMSLAVSSVALRVVSTADERAVMLEVLMADLIDTVTHIGMTFIKRKATFTSREIALIFVFKNS